jgi:DNA-binding YbaB/EbfC family protein
VFRAKGLQAAVGGWCKIQGSTHKRKRNYQEVIMAAKGIGDIMRQAQKLQTQMAKVQEEMAEKTVEGSSGGGMVTVIASGKLEVVGVTIDPEVIDPDDIEMLQDLVVAAVNDALRKAQEMVSGEMGKLTGGLGINIPGLNL